jgi:Trypsin-co-occurring domain 2
MANDFVPLADAIRALRQELHEAMQEGEADELRFELGTIELEFNAVVTTETDGKVKASFKLLGWGAEAAAGAKVSDKDTQKIKLSLSPVRATDPGQPAKKVQISSKK